MTASKPSTLVPMRRFPEFQDAPGWPRHLMSRYLSESRIADSADLARVYRFEVARGFRDDVAHLSDLISPGGEAFWPVGSLASGKPLGQSGIAA